MKVRITFPHEATSRAPEGTFTVVDGKRMRLPGLEIEGEDVWKLVGCGLAEPADDECAAMFNPEQITAAKESGHPMLMRQLAEKVVELKQAEESAEIFDDYGDDETA
jgi:hypothetical protein